MGTSKQRQPLLTFHRPTKQESKRGNNRILTPAYYSYASEKMNVTGGEDADCVKRTVKQGSCVRMPGQQTYPQHLLIQQKHRRQNNDAYIAMSLQHLESAVR
jgi:hypothetical protein